MYMCAHTHTHTLHIDTMYEKKFEKKICVSLEWDMMIFPNDKDIWE